MKPPNDVSCFVEWLDSFRNVLRSQGNRWNE